MVAADFGGRAGLFIALCALSAFTLPACAQTNGPVTAFVDVNVLPMDRERIVPRQTVLVRDGRIEEIGSAGQVSVPPDARRIEGQGVSYLLPGLMDSHIHLDLSDSDPGLFPVYLDSGITTVINLRGDEGMLLLRDRILRGEVLAPTLYTSGPYTNLPGIRTPGDAERAVREQREKGFDLVKIHGDLRDATFDRLLKAGREEGILVAGHVPRNLPFSLALEYRQMWIVHGEELVYTHFQDLEEGRIPELAPKIAAAGIWLTPNLSAFESLSRQWGSPAAVDTILSDPRSRYLNAQLLRIWRRGYASRDLDVRPRIRAMYEFLITLTRELHDAGVPMLLGTDAPGAGIFYAKRQRTLPRQRPPVRGKVAKSGYM